MCFVIHLCFPGCGHCPRQPRLPSQTKEEGKRPISLRKTVILQRYLNLSPEWDNLHSHYSILHLQQWSADGDANFRSDRSRISEIRYRPWTLITLYSTWQHACLFVPPICSSGAWRWFFSWLELKWLLLLLQDTGQDDSKFGDRAFGCEDAAGVIPQRLPGFAGVQGLRVGRKAQVPHGHRHQHGFQ